MNLDSPERPRKQALAPPDWPMTIFHEGAQQIATVERRGIPMCQVSTTAVEQSEEQVRTDLAEKARAWIAEFLARDGSNP